METRQSETKRMSKDPSDNGNKVNEIFNNLVR